MAEINEIISQKAIDGIITGDKAISKFDETLIKFLKSIEQTNTVLAKVPATTENIAKAQKQTNDVDKEAIRIKKEQDSAAKALDSQRNKGLAVLAKQEAKEREMTATINKEAKSIADLRTQTSALITKRNQLDSTTDKGKAKIAEYNKRIDENNTKIKENVSGLEKQKIGIGGYETAITSALSKMGPFGQTINNITNSTKTYIQNITQAAKANEAVAVSATVGSRAMKILKIALVSTGIGALIVAVGTLYQYFTRTERGADALRKIMAGIRAVIDVLIDRAVRFGEGLFQIFSGDFKQGLDKIRNTFTGITEEISKEYELSRKLADELDKIKDFKRAANVEQARLSLEVQKELEIARDQEYTAKQRLAAWERANRLARENREIVRVSNEMEMKNLLATLDLAENTEDVNNKAAELQAKMYNDEKTAQTEINSLLKLGAKIKKEVAEEDAQIAKMMQSRAMGEIETLGSLKTEYKIATDNKIELEKQLTDEIKKENLARIDDAKNRAEEEAKLEEERQKQRIEIAQNAVQALGAIGDTIFEMKQTALTQESEAIAKQKAYELQLAGDNQEKINAINLKYAKKEAELKNKQAKADHQAAIFKGIQNLALGIVSMFQAGPAGIALAAATAALGAVQLGVIATNPVPQFAKGTKSAPKGLMQVGERGRELIETDNGLFMANKPTIVGGIEGARIYSNKETERLMQGRDRIGVNLQPLLASNDRIVKTIQNKTEWHYSAEKRELTARKGDYWQKYKNVKLH